MNIDVYTDHGQIDRKLLKIMLSLLVINSLSLMIELLSKHNGLTPQNNYFEFLDHNNEFTDRDVYFYSYGYEEIEIWDEEDRKKYEDSIKKDEAIELNQPDEYMYEFMDKHIVIFGECAGGDLLAFDYRDDLDTDEPPITLIYHDDLIQISPTENKLRTIKLADNFTSFMALLKEDNF